MGHPAMTGLRGQKKRETWQALRSAAHELVAERGYDAASIEEIAAAAHVSKRTFFNYFDSKEAVLFDPDPDEPAYWRALLAVRAAKEPVWVSLREVLLEYTGQTMSKLIAHKRMAAASATLAQSSRSSTDDFWTLVNDWILERNPQAGDFEAAVLTRCAQAVLRTAISTWSIEDGTNRLQDRIRAGFDLVGRGLLPA